MWRRRGERAPGVKSGMGARSLWEITGTQCRKLTSDLVRVITPITVGTPPLCVNSSGHETYKKPNKAERLDELPGDAP
jgi:hypothetical protein